MGDATTLHVRNAMDGSGTSTEWIFERFTPLVEAQVRMRLGAAARSADVEDIVSDTWVVVLQKMGELSPRGGRFAPVLLKFLGTTAIQLCNNHLRRMIRTNMRHATPGVATSTSSDPMAELARRTLGVLTRVGRNETMEAVRDALATLEDDKRHLLVLRLVEGHSNQEIAEILDEKPNTIAVRYRRALDALRDVLPQQVLHDILGM